jgi:acyl-CoA synthetase (AMP-forming)/AMP-acid ligase II
VFEVSILVGVYPPVSDEPIVKFSPAERLSYSEIILRASELTPYLRQVVKHKRFVMLYSDPCDTLIMTYAALLAEQIAILQAPLSSFEEGQYLEALMQKSGIQAVVTSHELKLCLDNYAPGLSQKTDIFSFSPQQADRK